MNMVNKILSSLVAIVLIGSNIHIIDSAHFSKVGDYNICAVDCEETKHSSSHDDCDLCNKNIREYFIVANSESLINYYDNLLFDKIGIITTDISKGLFNTRAPPSYIS